MSSINNIEKLIQIATIEQMYLMLEKLKSNNTASTSTCESTSTSTHLADISLCLSNDFVIGKQVNKLKKKINKLNNILNESNNTICKLSIKINELEQELTSIKNTNNNFEKHQIKGQQTLDSYYGFFNSLSRDHNTQTYNDYIKEEIIINQEIDLNEDDDIEYLENNKEEPIIIVIDEHNEDETVEQIVKEELKS